MAGVANTDTNAWRDYAYAATQANMPGQEANSREQYGIAKGGQDVYNWLLKNGNLFSPETTQASREGAMGALGGAFTTAMGMPVGYTPEEQRKIRAGVGASTSAPYRAAAQQGKLNAARTGNAASLAPMLRGLAQDRSMGLTQTLGQLPGFFHNAAVSDAATKAGTLGGVASGFGAAQGREANALPLFQFPVTSGLQGYNIGSNNMTNLMQQLYGAYGTALPQATKPGFMSNTFGNLISNVPNMFQPVKLGG